MIGTAFTLAATTVKQVWWKILLKNSAEVAARSAASEGTRRILQKVTDIKKPLNRRLKKLDIMLKKNIVTEEEYKNLRKRIIDECGPNDL